MPKRIGIEDAIKNLWSEKNKKECIKIINGKKEKQTMDRQGTQIGIISDGR